MGIVVRLDSVHWTRAGVAGLEAAPVLTISPSAVKDLNLPFQFQDTGFGAFVDLCSVVGGGDCDDDQC